METTVFSGERRTGRTTRAINAAIDAARAGYTVFFFSASEIDTLGNLYKCAALLDKRGAGYSLKKHKRLFQMASEGGGSVRFRTIARDGFNVMLRPSLAPNINRDTRFADAVRGLTSASLMLDHHAEYTLDRDERRHAERKRADAGKARADA